LPEDQPYTLGLLAELEARAPAFEGRLVSIYLGGGTPSLWTDTFLGLAIDQVAERFAAAKADLEITHEANPTDCTDRNLRTWRSLGINRLSIGVQSLAPDELVVLGRDHRFGDGRAAIDRVQAYAGFTVSADFILGVPPRSQPELITTNVAP
jgi:oxygen-independent coproporphyrinogen-3 oxidase